ncbi:guanine nucleotide-binding protein subunit beta-like protein 1 [Chrysoperla carnea]|uniref:guanine nucleotide-binding protein subunit beta-like protein 1 n=1 Tax=Chrysoperla carnea TaxID=189513 RepID=UPI001D0720E1|nr:guanine nucleotide-binding protein subunit beta-like protein 1 [Chrysoperla carnea]
MAVLPPDPVFTLKQNDVGLIHCLCFPPTPETRPPNRLLAGTEKGFLYIWSLDSNRVLNKIFIGNSLLSIQHTDDKMITTLKSGEITVWNMENECQYKELHKLESGPGFCRTILAQDKYIATNQSNSTVEIYDFMSKLKVASFVPDADSKFGNVMCLQHININENDYILSGYESGDLLLWDTKSSKTPLSQLKLREFLTSMDFDIANYRGICGNSSNYLQVFNLDRSLNLSLKCELSMTNNGSNVVKIRPDRKVFVSGGWDGFLRIYSWKSLRPLAVLTEHKGALCDITFSDRPVSSWKVKLMAAAGNDAQISLWDLYNN